MIPAILALAADETEGNGTVGEHLLEHVADKHWIFQHFGFGAHHFEPTQHWAWFVASTLVVLGLLRWALWSYGKGGVPKGPAAAIEAIVLFIRDEIAEPNLPHEGELYTPLLCSFFFFILIAALLGLVPKAKTPTGNIAVTMGLATISLFAMQWAGIKKHGLGGHIAGLVPHGLPWPLIIIIFPIEVLGIFTKPFALMVRLFANMLAGHMVITTLLLLIPLMFAVKPVFGVGMIPVSLGLALFIMVLEVLVAFIQAYIFTLLTAIFIGMYAHPAH
jgi:F-type H+-transporting ATPase subunit a